MEAPGLASNIGSRQSLAPDVADYSRPIETDEEGALGRLKAGRAEP